VIEFSARSKSLGSNYSWRTYNFFGREKAVLFVVLIHSEQNFESYHLTSLKAASNPEIDPSSTWSGTQ